MTHQRHINTLFVSVALLLPMLASAQTVIDNGPRAPYWSMGFAGVPHTFQQPDRDDLISFSFDWTEADFPKIRTVQPNSYFVGPEGQVFTVDVPADIVDVMLDDVPMVQPTGFDFHPTENEIWVADYGANQIKRVDLETQAVTVVHDGDSSDIDGPWDVTFLVWFDRPSGSFSYNDQTYYPKAYVSSHNNHRLIRLSMDGAQERAFWTNLTHPTSMNCHEITPFGELTSWLGLWTGLGAPGCSGLNVTSFDQSNYWSFSPNASYYIWSQKNLGGLGSGIMGSAPAPGGTVFASSGTDEILRYTNWTGEVMVPASAGLNRPQDVIHWEPTPDVLGWRQVYLANGSNNLDRGISPTEVLYVADSGNRRVASVNYLTGETETFVQYIDLEPIELVIDHATGDLYVFLVNPDTSALSLYRYPRDVSLTIETVGAPAETVLGFSPHGHFQRPYRSWLFDDDPVTDRFVIATQRDREFNVHVGFTDPTAASNITLRASLSDGHALPRPVVLAHRGAEPGSVVVDVETPEGPLGEQSDEVILYEITGCDSFVNLSGTRDQSNGRTPFRFPHVEDVVQFDLGDLDECAVELDRQAPNPSGTTQFDLSETPYFAGARYCFAAVQRDTTTNTYSQPSLSEDGFTCLRVPASDDGVFCGSAVDASPYSEQDGYGVNQANDSGRPAWFQYTVEGSPDEERRLFFFVHRPSEFNDNITLYGGTRTVIVDGGDPLFTLFNRCPESGGHIIGENNWTLDQSVRGGDTVTIRFTHMEPLNPTWMLLDLPANEDPALPTPSNLTATSGRSGEIMVCWDEVSEFAGIPIQQDLISYQVERRAPSDNGPTVLQQNWRFPCYLDQRLPPDANYDYQVQAVLRMRVIPNQVDPFVVVSPLSERVAGDTSSVDLRGQVHNVAPPTGLALRILDPNDQNFFSAAGTVVWWDHDAAATSHRVTQTYLNTGATEDFIIAGGAHAAEIPTGDLGLYCYDVRSRHDGEPAVESVPTGYSQLADAQYCVDLCEDSAQDVHLLQRVDPTRRRRLGRGAERLVQRPVEYFKVDLQGFSGVFHLTNASGNPAQACAWQGTDCGNLTPMGCAMPNSAGNTAMDFVVDATQPVYVMWKLLPQNGESPEDLKSVRFTVGFAENTPTETDTPAVALEVVDNTCSSEVAIDYVITNWEPRFDSYISFRVGGIEVGRGTDLVGTVVLPVSPLDALHEIEALIFDDPLEAVFTRSIYASAGPFLGDINEDCSVDVADIVLLLNHVLAVGLLDEVQILVADWNSDSFYDMLDIVGMVTHVLEGFD